MSNKPISKDYLLAQLKNFDDQILDEKYVADTDIIVIDSATIEEMLGLNSDEILGLASLLSDQTIELSKTWSSSKIYSELANTLNESKAYTLSELSKTVGASYKVVTSIDQMTDSKVLYLLKDSDDGMYNIYVYDENATSAELIGSFEINLDDYYTKAECDERYVLATAFELLNNSIGNVNNLQTTSKVIVDAINEVVISVDGMSTTVTEIKDALGDITALETTAKDNVVNAVNEVKKSIDEFETYVELTQEEYDALADDETGKLNGTEYRTTDTGKIYKNGVQYGGQEPEVIEGFAKYKEMKEAGLIDDDAEYIVSADENGILLEASDIGYSNAVSNLPCTTVQGAVDKVVEKVDSKIAEIKSEVESIYITDSIANTLYYACEYFGLDCRNQYQVLEIEVIDVKGQNLKFNSIYKHEVLHHAQVISENGITLKAIDTVGTLAFENASDYTIKVKHIDICPDSIGDTLVTVINRANKNALASEIGAKVGKALYRGSRSIDISTGGKLTLIYSSEYASQAGCYMLLSNFNTEPLLIELGRTNIGQFSVTATHKSQNVDTITVTTAGDEYSWYVLQF